MASESRKILALVKKVMGMRINSDLKLYAVACICAGGETAYETVMKILGSADDACGKNVRLLEVMKKTLENQLAAIK